MIYELKDPSKAAPVFAGWADVDAGVLACLDGVMGKILVTDPDCPKSALAVIGDFAFCAGEPDLELLGGKPDKWMLVVPENDAWASMIEDNFPASKRIRYAIRKDTVFDRDRLEAMVKALPEGYELRRIDGGLYDLCLKEEIFEDCVSVFGSKEKYLELGRGFAVLKDGKIVSAASSYSRYLRGIDIEIDTVKEEQHKGLGAAAAARLLRSLGYVRVVPARELSKDVLERICKALNVDVGDICSFRR